MDALKQISINDLGRLAFVTRTIGVAIEMDVFKALRTSRLTLSELEKQTKLPGKALQKIVAALSSFDLVMIEPQGIQLTTRGRELADPDGPHLSWLRMVNRPWYWDSIKKLGFVLTDGKSGVEITTGLEFFEFLTQNPAEQDIYNAAMLSLMRPLAREVCTAFEFDRYTRMIDIAGGRGYFARTVASLFPKLEVCLFDRAPVIESAKNGDATIQFRAGSFFESIPDGFDLYFLNRIIHDWDDENSVKILRNICQSMESKANLCLIERVLDEAKPSTASVLADLNMRLLYGQGQERTLREFEDLFRISGLRIEKTVSLSHERRILVCGKI